MSSVGKIVFPFDDCKNYDSIGFASITAKHKNVDFVTGPDGGEASAVSFRGTKYSYVLIPNSKKLKRPLDFVYDLTIAVHVYPTKEQDKAPIWKYRPENSGGISLWQIGTGLRFNVMQRAWTRISNDRIVEAPKGSLKINEWNYVAVSYSYTTSEAKIYINGKEVATKTIPKKSIATGRNVRLGQWRKYHFAGHMACFQAYPEALSEAQILTNKDCPKGMGLILHGALSIEKY